MAGDERVRAVAELLASASELIHNSGYTEDVTPAQWAALRYFSTANPTAADLMSYARHHGTTKGTASRTVTRLEDKGLLERRRVAGDLRRRLITITPAGRRLLKRDPVVSLAGTLSDMADRELEVLAVALMRVVRHHFEGGRAAAPDGYARAASTASSSSRRENGLYSEADTPGD